jgi:hypothetical protein
MPSRLQIKVGARLSIWLLTVGLTFSSWLYADGSLRASCRPSYLLLPAVRSTVLLLGCRDSLNSLHRDHLKALSSFVDKSRSEGQLNEGSLPALNRLAATSGNGTPIINVVVGRSGKWLPVSGSAQIGIIPISGREASALIVARRELLGPLRKEGRSLADALDVVVRSHRWELLSHAEDQRLRDELVRELLKHAKHRLLPPESGKGEDKADIDLFIWSGRIGESL